MMSNKILSALNDGELLSLLKDDETKSAAFNEVYRRHAPFLYNLCLKYCKTFYDGDQIAEDVFQATMLKIYEKGYKCGIVKGEYSEESKQVKKWLSIIARNEFYGLLRNNPDDKMLGQQFRTRSSELPEDEFTYLPDFELNEAEKKSIQRDYLDRALESLPEREREILRTYMLFYDPQHPKRHLPDKTLSELSVRYQVKPEYLRKIKDRALITVLGKIKEYQNENQKK